MRRSYRDNLLSNSSSSWSFYCKKKNCDKHPTIEVYQVVNEIRYSIGVCDNHTKWAAKYLNDHLKANQDKDATE